MNPRPNFTFPAMLMVVLCAAWVSAQDNPYPAPVVAAPQGILGGPQPPIAPFESVLPQPGPFSFSISDGGVGNQLGPPTPTASGGRQSPDYMGLQTDFSQAPQLTAISTQGAKPQTADADKFNQVPRGRRRFDVGVDLYSPPEFEGGLIVYGQDVAMKIGGFVKADFIYDFDPIDSTDSFDTTTIPVGAPPRTNTRFHTRQTRLSFDTRWLADERTIRVYVEGDFFDANSERFRLRHAYGEVGPLLVGRTWTTFTDVSAAPATLDFEGSVSSVNRRQAQARWTQMLAEDIILALAVEDTRFIIQVPEGVTGDARSPSPDFVGHLRLERDLAQYQIAGLYRIGGFQPTGEEVITGSAWGLNFTGAILLAPATKTYYQILFGEGIGSYRSLPDAAPETESSDKLLPLFGWMVGFTHEWNDTWSSNFTYAENSLDNAAMQAADDVHRTSYLAVNLVWKPLERVWGGIEYLYGLRENVDREVGAANRLQVAFVFDLP
jgi:hypothetical protein